MIRIIALFLLVSVYLNGQTRYNIFITSFTKDKKEAAANYQTILSQYLKLNDINEKVALNKTQELLTIKIINFKTLEEAKTAHKKIKKEFENSFIQEVELSGLDELHKKAMEFLKNDKPQEAYEILHNSYQSNNFNKQTLFLLALSAKNADNKENAIYFYEELLALDSSAHRIRLDLGDLYYQIGEYKKANEQFLIVKAAKIPTPVENNIESYKQKKRIENQKNYNVFASLGYMRDSNVNAGPTVDTITMYDIEFTLSDDAKETDDSAYTAKAGGSIYNSFESFLLSSSLNVSKVDYSQLDDYDNQSYSISTTPIFFDNKSIYLFPLSYNNIDLGISEDYYLKYVAFNPTMKNRISSFFTYSVKLNFEKKDYEAIPTKNGLTYGVAYGFELQDEKTTNINIEAHINRNKSEDDIYSYNNTGIKLSYSNLLLNNLYFLGNLNFELNYYDKAEDAFEVKKDEYNLNGSLNFIYDLNFYNSNITFSYYNQYNSSNIDLYKYKRSLAMLSYSISY